MNDSTVPFQPNSLIGTWRRFGDVGPVYEVIGVVEVDAAEGPAMRVRVLETCEEVDYHLSDLLHDPSAG